MHKDCKLQAGYCQYESGLHHLCWSRTGNPAFKKYMSCYCVLFQEKERDNGNAESPCLLFEMIRLLQVELILREHQLPVYGRC